MDNNRGPAQAFGRAVGMIIAGLVSGIVILGLLAVAAWMFRIIAGTC